MPGFDTDNTGMDVHRFVPPGFSLINPWLLCASLVLASSCSLVPPAREKLPPPSTEEQSAPQEPGSEGGALVGLQEKPFAVPPEQAIPHPLPRQIMGEGFLTENELSSFLLASNADLEDHRIRELSASYVEEASLEGVNHDIAFAQMCLETGFLRFGNLVTADMNNFCGLGAIGPGQSGERFETVALGVRAHIQHLKAYASEEPLKQDLVDPRYKWVKKGSSPHFEGLAGTWAADPHYGEKLQGMLVRLYALAGYELIP